MSAPNGTTNDNPPPQAQSMRVTNIVNNDTDVRDSAYYSEGSSKHTSAASFAPNVHSPTGSGNHSSPMDKTPSPTTSNHHVPHIVSPTGDAPDSRHYERSSYPEPGVSGTPMTYADTDSLSRRTSVDSRINQGFSDMRLAGPSPYNFHNQSSGSIQNTLTTQRHPRPGYENMAMNRVSNGYQPSAERNPEPNPHRISRTAPVIGGPTAGTVARAAEPTKGQAWAFPDSDTPRPTPNGQAYEDSRRSSVADSFASSQFTSESRLPPGQRRLDEAGDYTNRILHVHQDYPAASMERRMSQDDDESSPGGRGPSGSQPYSRTPESRQSHKLAERKRRTEMKELFETLRDLMPQDRGAKASKWEILQKAISEHTRQHEQIRALQAQNDILSRENQVLRSENQQLRMQMTGHRDSYGGAPPPAPAPVPGPYGVDPYANPRTELPPLRSIGASHLPPAPPQAPESMSGVQYEGSRAPSYHTERR